MYSSEYHSSRSEESFISLEQMRRIIPGALRLAERINDAGIIQQPSFRAAPGSALYAAATRVRQPIRLTIHETAELSRQQFRALRHNGVWKDSHQIMPAFHFKNEVSSTPEFAETRLYVAGGVQGLALVGRLIENGANFAQAKVWSPELEPGRLQMLRTDTPILTVRTHHQLASTVAALREMSSGSDIAPTSPFLGQTIGIPGVYLAQTARGTSFNGTMKHLWDRPLAQAWEDTELLPGERLTEEQVDAMAYRARQDAVRLAPEMGVSPENHAFLLDEPIGAILSSAGVSYGDGSR